MLKKLIFLSLSLFLLAACGGNKGAAEGEKDGMAEFADDQEFKDAHDTPEENDHQAAGEMITFSGTDGADASAYALMTKDPSDKYLFVIHEWWGLNDHIKEEADRLFGELGDVNVMALDMYDGKVATSREDAGKFMQAVKPERAEAIVKGAIAKAGGNAKIGTIGWCFGKQVETHQFDAAHAFANPSNPKYDEEAAKEANTMALNFLKERLQ